MSVQLLHKKLRRRVKVDAEHVARVFWGVDSRSMESTFAVRLVHEVDPQLLNSEELYTRMLTVYSCKLSLGNINLCEYFLQGCL